MISLLGRARSTAPFDRVLFTYPVGRIKEWRARAAGQSYMGIFRVPKILLDTRTKEELERTMNAILEEKIMARFARESLALASVVGFVWMVCQAAQLAA